MSSEPGRGGISCEELDQLLQPYVDDEVEGWDRIEADGHLARCAQCAAKVERETRFRRMVRAHVASTVRAAPDRLRDSVRGALHREARRGQRLRITQGVAALVVVLVGGTAVLQLRTPARNSFLEDAARRHARGLPHEIQREPAEHVERWFDGKLDHRVAVPRLRNAVVTGARLSNVREKQAAYISYEASAPDGGHPRRVGLFVIDDTAREIEAEPLPRMEVGTSHGYNVAIWRSGEIVYQLVTDLDQADIRGLVEGQLQQGIARERTPPLPVRPASLQR